MKITPPLLSLILLAPLFFTSIPLAAMKKRKKLAIHNVQKIKKQKISLTQEQQNKVDHDLYDAIRNDNLKNVSAALNAGADITNKKISPLLYTSIQEAAHRCCHPDIFKVLFSHDANPQIQKPKSNQSLLHLLMVNPEPMKSYFIETIKTLLQHKVSLYLIDHENNTPLHLATINYEECATISKKPNSHIHWKQDLLIFYDVIKLLLFAGADHKKTNNKNKTALDLINQNDKTPIERLIDLSSFFNLNLSKNLSNLLPLHLQVPGIPTIIFDYLNPQPTEEEQKLWDELAPIREIQQELLMAPQNTLSEEEKQ